MRRWLGSHPLDMGLGMYIGVYTPLPSVLTPGGSHHTYGRHVGSMHPTEMHSCC